jgi:polar amino acid transport system substrate-binding protein
VQDLGALHDYTVGTVRGYANPPAFDAAKLRTEEVVDDLTNLKKLAANRIDLTLIDMALAQWLIRKNMPDAARKIVALEPPVETMPLYLGISRKTADYARVVSDFNRGLAKIRRNGEYAKILQRLPLDSAK